MLWLLIMVRLALAMPLFISVGLDIDSLMRRAGLDAASDRVPEARCILERLQAEATLVSGFQGCVETTVEIDG